jgi:hypothetical protein
MNLEPRVGVRSFLACSVELRSVTGIMATRRRAPAFDRDHGNPAAGSRVPAAGGI